MRETFRATDPLLAGFGRSRVIRAVVFARVVHAIFRFVAPRSRAEAIHEVRRAVFLVEVERGRDGVVPAFVVLSRRVPEKPSQLLRVERGRLPVEANHVHGLHAIESLLPSHDRGLVRRSLAKLLPRVVNLAEDACAERKPEGIRLGRSGESRDEGKERVLRTRARNRPSTRGGQDLAPAFACPT